MVVALPAVNSAPEAGVMNALSLEVEVCAADSEKVARRPNARVKKRILLFSLALRLQEDYSEWVIEKGQGMSSLYVRSKEWHEP